MRSIYDNAVVAGLCGPKFNTLTATAATSGTSVDTKGYNSGAVRVFLTPTATITGLSSQTQSTLTVVLQESADNNTFTSALDNTGTAIGGTVTATSTAVIASFRVEGLNQNRLRYLRVVTTPFLSSGVRANNDAAFTSVAVIELSRAYTRPVTSTVSNT